MTTPTTQQVADDIIAAIAGEIGKQIPILPKSFTRVLAKALSGVYILLWKYANFSLLQYFVEHASWDETEINGRKLRPLVELGLLFGAGYPKAGTNARLAVLFAVDNPDATVLAAGRQMVHPSSGFIYILEDAVTLDSSVKTVNVIAASDPDGNGGTGTGGNRQTAQILEWANRPPQVSAQGATVITVVQTAANPETEDAYRSRVRERVRNRPNGGAYVDYRVWATEAAGVVGVYPYTGDIPGTVEVYVEASEASSGNEDGTPTPAQLDAVRALVEADSAGIAARRPVSAFVIVNPISRQPFNVEVTGLDVTSATADATTIESTIKESLSDYFGSLEPFIEGLSRLPKQDRATSAAIAGVVFEAASAFGATVASVEAQIGSGAFTVYQLGKGQKAKLGAVSFV